MNEAETRAEHIEPVVSEPRRPRPPDEPKPPVDPPPPRQKTKVKLADGKARTIQHMMVTTFWHPDGAPMSAQRFMEMLFGKLPAFFKNEAELRSLWSSPDTRARLLHGLAEKGFGHDQLIEMQKIIDAEKSDLFDVLAHVAYALPPMMRETRAANARVHIIASPPCKKENDYLPELRGTCATIQSFVYYQPQLKSSIFPKSKFVE